MECATALDAPSILPTSWYPRCAKNEQKNWQEAPDSNRLLEITRLSCACHYTSPPPQSMGLEPISPDQKVGYLNH